MIEQESITETKLGLETGQLLQILTLSIGASADFGVALDVVLQKVCQLTNWAYGEAWIPDVQAGVLTCSPIWYGDGSQTQQQFRQFSQSLTFAPNLGLPGRIWVSKQPEWSFDVSQMYEPAFYRAQPAVEAGFRAGLGIPVAANGRILAILVFFMKESREEDQRLVQLILAIATPLGMLMQLKQTETVLAETQRRLTSLIDSLPGIVFSAGPGPNWDMNYLSEGCIHLTGYRSDELVGRQRPLTYNDITHPDDLPVVLEAIATAITQRQPYVVEYRIATKSGLEKWLWEKGSGIYDDRGEAIGLEGFITDVTQRKVAEKTLQEKEEFLRLVLDNVLQSIFWKDKNLVYQGGNRQWASLIGVGDPDRVIGLTDYAVFQKPHLAERYIQEDRQVLESGVPLLRQIESEPVAPGQYRWQEVSKIPIRNAEGEIIGILGTLEDVTDRRQIEEALKTAEQKYRSIFENAVEGIFQTSVEGRYLTVNPMLAQIYGYESPEDLMTQLTNIQHQLYVDPNRRSEFTRLLQEQESVWGFESEVYRRDGSIIWISENARACRDERGNLLGYEGTVEDITERKRAEVALHRRDSLLQGVAEATYYLLTNPDHQKAISQAIAALGMATQVDRVYIFENHPHSVTGEVACSTRFEWTQDNIEPILHQLRWQDQSYSRSGLSRWYRLLSGGQTISGTVNTFPPDEQVLLEQDNVRSLLITPIFVEEQFWGFIGFDDCHSEREWSRNEEAILMAIAVSMGAVIQRCWTEDMIRYQAFHDLLTGLPNRLSFNERLLQALTVAQDQQRLLAVMFLDLDRFKTINDTLGHAVGDLLLCSATQRMVECLRESDTIARWGGDEFTLLLPNLTHVGDSIRIAERILASLQPAFQLDQHELYITCSIGIALYPQSGLDAQTLLKNADAALYRAKERGRNNYQVYTDVLNSQASERLTLANSLHHALERDEFILHYQPQINSVTGAITQMQAMLYWQHPDSGLIPPQTFMAVAEEDGLMIPIGEWAIATATRQNKLWQMQGLPPIRMAVNLSMRQFQQPNLIERFVMLLNQTGMDPTLLELEITENTVVMDINFSLTVLHELKSMGVRISMGGFGTGSSSLGCLKRLPVDALKIDASFIQDLSSDPNDAAVIAAIIALGRGLGLTVIAEGVETQQQVDWLRSLQCYEIQGRWLSPPLEVTAATEFLRTYQPASIFR